MKYKFKFKEVFILAIIVGMLTSCSKYLDINKTPNAAFPDQVTPNLILPAAQLQLYGQQSTLNRLGNIWMGNWAPNIYAFTGGFATEYSLNLSHDFYNGIWDGLYLDVSKLEAIKDSPIENYEYHKAIAMILESYYMQNVVDLYGDIPYSEAFKGKDNLYPTYDKAFDVYKALVEQVDSAMVVIQNAGPNTVTVGDEDIIFGGDMSKWEKFANTVKLRLLMRLSSNPKYKSYITGEFASLQNAEFITENVTINPGFSTAQPNFLWNSYAKDQSGNEVQNHRFIRAAKFLVDLMDGSQTGVTDPRLKLYFEPDTDGNPIKGLIQGSNNNTANLVEGELAHLYIDDDEDGIQEGVLRSPDQDGLIYLASLSYFTQSEAALKSKIPGNAKALFQAGIKSSMDYLGVADSAITDYITTISAGSDLGPIDWDGNNLQALMVQQYFATVNTMAGESWIDYVRTGYPNIDVALTATRDNYPNRLPYPTSEYSTNSQNVPTQSIDEIFTTFIFWDPEAN